MNYIPLLKEMGLEDVATYVLDHSPGAKRQQRLSNLYQHAARGHVFSVSPGRPEPLKKNYLAIKLADLDSPGVFWL
jgi:hypothetical protein